MAVVGRPDVSDAGMAYWFFTGFEYVVPDGPSTWPGAGGHSPPGGYNPPYYDPAHTLKGYLDSASGCNIVNSAGCGQFGRAMWEGACSEGAYPGWMVAGGQWVTCGGCNIVNSTGCGQFGRAMWEGACSEGAYPGWMVAGGQWVTC